MTAVEAVLTLTPTERTAGAPADTRGTPADTRVAPIQSPVGASTARIHDGHFGAQPARERSLPAGVAAAEGATCWVRPAPEREPAFDDQPPARHLHLIRAAAAPQLPFPTPSPSPSGPSPASSPGSRGAVTPGRPRLTVVPDLNQAHVDLVAPLAPGEPASARNRNRPDPGRFSRQFAQGVVEVLSGRRPTAQLVRHVSPAVQRGLARAGGSQPLKNPTAPTLHSLHLSEPDEGVCEMSAVVVVGARYRALAARLEWSIDHWRCTALQVG